MKMELRMEGAVNGHKFVLTGEESGQPFEGKETMKLTVKESGPLPFAFDILTTVVDYGNRVFAKYPKDAPDYFKQSFPDGYSYDRITYEDGGFCIATNITMKKDVDNCFVYEIRFDGVNFPSSSSVMQRKTVKWEPSTEKMYLRDGVLKGDVNMAL